SLPAEIYELSPESTRLGNVVYLASELERLGARNSAIQVWRFALQKQKSPLDRLEAQVHLSNLEMLVGNRSQSVTDLEAALRLWPQVQPCPDPETCKELKNRIRNSLVEWNKNEAQSPSLELLGAYRHYLQVFSESDVSLWAAKVAGYLKDYAQAVDLYSGAARIEKGQPSVSAEKLEVALVGAMESAELSKQLGLRELSYTQYLNNSLQRKRELEVLYQRAKIIYDAGDPMRAAEAMREVAFSSAAGSEAVKAQAADLAMDALVLAKNDLLLERWAQDFSQRFPSRAQEFFTIQRNSVLNQVKALGGGELSSTQAESAWQLLARFPLSGSSHAEQITFYKNRLILAEKLLKYPEAREACDRLLGLPGVSSDDTNYALSRKAWLSEMIFDFDGAFLSTSKMSSVRTPEHWLKLALYAELAQRDPLPAYREFLKLSTDSEKKALIAAEIVKSAPAKNQVKELQNFKTILSVQPEIYAALAMEIYVQSMDIGFLNQTLLVPGVSATLSGKVLRRMQLLNDYESVRKLVKSHQIESANDRKLSLSLKKRVQLLEDAEKLVTRAVNAADWSAQLLSLQLLGDQSLRFYNEVMALPVPEGLTGEQEQMYLQALSQQASPFQVKAKDIEAKLKEFWSQSSALQNLNSDLSKSAGALEKLLWREYQLVAEVAPAEVK
ncbi:MAG: hypothetical protein WCH11_07065, partial [Bdellovibrio sp.]